MSSNKPSPQRLWCRMEGLRVALFGNGSPSRHQQECPDCQRRVQSQDALESALRNSAASNRIEAPPFLQQRILNTLRYSNSGVGSRVSGHAPSRAIWSPSLVACGVAACLVVFLFRAPDQPSPVGNEVASASKPGAASVAVVRNEQAIPATGATLDFGIDLSAFNSLTLQADDLLDAGPLQTEVRAVVLEAKSALQFLAMNFLPREVF